MNNTAMFYGVFQGICLIGRWVRGDILKPAEVQPSVQQLCVRQPGGRKKQTEKGKKYAGEGTSTRKTSI